MVRILRCYCLVALGLLGVAPAFANTAVSFTFSGLSSGEQVLGYYDGGLGSFGSGAGLNYGISFSPNATIFSGAHGNLLTGNGTIVMNVGPEFANSVKLRYAALSPETVNVWNGFDGTGILLATMTLMPSGWCHTLNCAWSRGAEGFSGTAASVTFSGTSGQFGIGAMTLGARYVGHSNSSVAAMGRAYAVVTPEPSALALLATGFAGLLLLQLSRTKSRYAFQRPTPQSYLPQ
jgi:hypothetical protein